MNEEGPGRMSTFWEFWKSAIGDLKREVSKDRIGIRSGQRDAEPNIVEIFRLRRRLLLAYRYWNWKLTGFLQWVSSDYKSITNAEQLPLFQHLFPSWGEDPNPPPPASVDAQHIMVSSTPREFKPYFTRRRITLTSQRCTIINKWIHYNI
jgi:hypothetical protein